MFIVMTKLASIEYKVNEDLHTIAYARDVKDWLKQWTVANNFMPICTVYEHIADDPITDNDVRPLVKAAQKRLIAQHIETLKKVFSNHTKIDRDYAEDFRFRFEVMMAKSGEPMQYKSYLA